MRAALLLSLPLLGACAPGGTYDPATCDVGNELGDCASDFTLRDGSETPWTLSEQLGTAVVVSFGQMWCTQCRRAAQDMAAIQPEYDPTELAMASVYFEDPAGQSVETSEVADYAEEYGIPFPVLADTDGAVEEAWGFSNGRPNLFVVDPLGIVTWRDSGHDSELADGIRGAIDEALARE